MLEHLKTLTRDPRLKGNGWLVVRLDGDGREGGWCDWATNDLLAEFAGRTPGKTFRIELACIIDTNESGMLVARNRQYNAVLPWLRVFHWLKRFFEWQYLRRFR